MAARKPKAGDKIPTVYVTVGDTTYPPGEPLPDGVAELIDNPKVFAEVDENEGQADTDGGDADDDA